MATITPESLALNAMSGGGNLAYDLVAGRVVPLNKIVFGNDSEIVASWSFNAGALDDGTPRVCLPTEQMSALASAANQATAIAHLATLAGAVAGSELQVDLVSLPSVSIDTLPALAAGDATIGRVKLTDGVDIASINDNGALHVHADNASPITEYQEDAPADADPGGGALILVRTDTLAGRTSANGDNVAACGTDRGEQYVAEAGAPNWVPDQVDIDATAGGTVIAAARANRRSITVVNLGTTDVWLGGNGVTATDGQLLLGVKGAARTIRTTAEVRAITASGTQRVAFDEEYD